MGVDGLTSESTAGETSYCIYSGADPLRCVATSFNASNANDIMAAFGGQDGVTEVSGIGDRALWDSNSATRSVARRAMPSSASRPARIMDVARARTLRAVGAIAAERM